MPVNECTLDGKSGYKWGEEGKCYTYAAGDEEAKKAAKKKAAEQGLAIGLSDNLNDKGSFFIGCNEILFTDDGDIKAVQILKVGEYTHPVYGKIPITSSILRSMEKNFKGNVRNIKIAFNYDHGQSKAHGTKASGWFSDIELRNNGSELWVIPDWTPDGIKQIKAKEYLYTSAEILPKYKDALTGQVFNWVLEGAALTNKPFIKGMEAIAASEIKPKEKRKNDMNLGEMKVKLADEHNIDLNDLQKKATQLVDVKTEVTSLNERVSTLETDKKKLEGENAGLKSKVELAEKENNEIVFKDLVKKGMDEGKLTKNMSEGIFKQMFETNGKDFCEAYLSEAPKYVNTDDHTGHGEDKKGNEGKTASEKIAKLSDALAKAKDISLSEAQEKVMEQNPDLVEALDKETDKQAKE